MTSLRLSILVVSLFPVLAIAGPLFEIRAEESGQICQVYKGHLPPKCYTALPAGTSIDLREEIRLMNEAEAQSGSSATSQISVNVSQWSAALLMKPQMREQILRDYQKLKVTDIAIAEDRIHKTRLGRFLPLVARLHWKGAVAEGVLHFETHVQLPEDNSWALPNLLLDRVKSIDMFVSAVRQLFTVRALSDGSYQMRALRVQHFRNLKGFYASPDTESKKIIQEAVGPALFSKFVLMPYLERIQAPIENKGPQALLDDLKQSRFQISK